MMQHDHMWYHSIMLWWSCCMVMLDDPVPRPVVEQCSVRHDTRLQGVFQLPPVDGQARNYVRSANVNIRWYFGSRDNAQPWQFNCKLQCLLVLLLLLVIVLSTILYYSITMEFRSLYNRNSMVTGPTVEKGLRGRNGSGGGNWDSLCHFGPSAVKSNDVGVPRFRPGEEVLGRRSCGPDCTIPFPCFCCTRWYDNMIYFMG